MNNETGDHILKLKSRGKFVKITWLLWSTVMEGLINLGLDTIIIVIQEHKMRQKIDEK